MKVNPPQIFAIVVLVLFAGACGGGPKMAAVPRAENGGSSLPGQEKEMVKKIEKSENEWKASLTPEQYKVLRRSGTERPFTGKYNDHYEAEDCHQRYHQKLRQGR
jgi:hypothetical protein